MKVDPSKGHPAMDYDEHNRTYAAFVKMFTWGTIACVIILILMAAPLV